MKAETIYRWIKSLGRTYNELVSDGIISNMPLQTLYEGRNLLHVEPGAGLELDFGAESKRLVKLQIILNKMVEGQTIYNDELPAPYSLRMSQADVRTLFGTPTNSKGPVKLPGGLGMRGGWDAYPLQEDAHLNADVWFNYTADLAVYSIVFAIRDQ